MALKRRDKIVLTDEAKARGRLFRDAQTEALDFRIASEQPTYTPVVWLAVFRHLCPGRKNVSTALQLKEVYITDESGEFCFIYKAGKCRSCGETAITPMGKFDLTARRPPLEGRIARS